MTQFPVSGGAMPPEIKREIETALNTLRDFNRKVDRLETTKFWQRYKDQTPNVIMKMKNVTFEKTGHSSFAMAGPVQSWLEEFDQDEIDAFVLTYRLFHQDNDRISLKRISGIYALPWMQGGNALECFEDARQELNDHLDQAATIMFGDAYVSVRFIADVVIYGGLAHMNAEKSRIFDAWQSGAAKGFIWAEFFALMRHAMELLLYLREINAKLLSNIETHGFIVGPVETNPHGDNADGTI